MAELKAYQREVKSVSEVKDTEWPFVDKANKRIVASDTTHPEYVKDKEAKEKKKLAKRTEIKERKAARDAAILERGKAIGAREYRQSDKFAAKLESARARGAREARPAVNRAERAAKMRSQAAELSAKAGKLETATKSAKLTKTEKTETPSTE